MADDEPLILKGLRKLIRWEQLGIEIIAQADDGRSLLDLIESLQPDIVISDINMPNLSGIDIIKEINARKWNVKVIFISAYQEFAYARDAVAFGAVDYLVKPVKKLELESVLIKTMAMIREENEDSQRRGKLQILERNYRNSSIREWLVQLTDGLLSPQADAFRALLSEFPGPLHTVGIIQLDPVGNETDRWPLQEKKLLDFAVENIVSEVVSAFGHGHVFLKNNRHVFVTDHQSPEEPFRLAEDIKTKIISYLKLNASIGIGIPSADLISLAESYAQAEQALQMSYFLGLNRVILYKPYESEINAGQDWYDLQSAVIRAMTANQWEEAEQAAKQLLKTIEAATIGNRSLAVSTCFSSVLFIIQEVKKSGIQLSDSGFDIQDLQGRLGRYETFADMERGILDILEELHNRIDNKAENKEKLLMVKVKRYVEEHYAEEITLESMSSIVFMNPYYFSSFFKKHTQQNFKQYVTEVRMNAAVRLLSQTDLMVYEIAEKVGYNNARHFSDMFKKRFGKLPQEYKQSLRK